MPLRDSDRAMQLSQLPVVAEEQLPVPEQRRAEAVQVAEATRAPEYSNPGAKTPRPSEQQRCRWLLPLAPQLNRRASPVEKNAMQQPA